MFNRWFNNVVNSNNFMCNVLCFTFWTFSSLVCFVLFLFFFNMHPDSERAFTLVFYYVVGGFITFFTSCKILTNYHDKQHRYLYCFVMSLTWPFSVPYFVLIASFVYFISYMEKIFKN